MTLSQFIYFSEMSIIVNQLEIIYNFGSEKKVALVKKIGFYRFSKFIVIVEKK